MTAPPSSPPWARAAMALAAVGVTADALRYLYLRWISLDRAVFEADVYAQGIARALHQGAVWPWNLTPEFWPFLTMAPGIYLFIPLFAVFKGGFATLVTQAVGMGISALLVFALAARRCPPGSIAPLALGLAWLAHPLVGVGMAWGWSFYTFGAPFTLAGALCLDARRWGWAALFLLLAASMKVNVAVGIAGLALWAMFQRDRPWGTPLLVGAGAWIALTGTLFLSGLMASGRLSHDLHLGGSAPAATAGGILTVAATALPLAPLLRRTWPLALTAAGLELIYSAALNPANSGLIPATALLFIAACEGLPTSRRPGVAAGAALALACVARLAFNPPVVGPLPLTPAALGYEVDPRGAVVRAAVDGAPPEATLVVSESLMGSIGRHVGPVRPADRGPAHGGSVLVYEGASPPAWAAGCATRLTGEGEEAVWFGACASPSPPAP